MPRRDSLSKANFCRGFFACDQATPVLIVDPPPFTLIGATAQTGLLTAVSRLRRSSLPGCELRFRLDRGRFLARSVPLLEEVAYLLQAHERYGFECESRNSVVDTPVRRPRIALVAPFDLEQEVALLMVGEKDHFGTIKTPVL